MANPLQTGMEKQTQLPTQLTQAPQDTAMMMMNKALSMKKLMMTLRSRDVGGEEANGGGRAPGSRL